MHQVGVEIREDEILQQAVAEFGEDTKVHQIGGSSSQQQNRYNTE